MIAKRKGLLRSIARAIWLLVKWCACVFAYRCVWVAAKVLSLLPYHRRIAKHVKRIEAGIVGGRMDGVN